MNVERRGKLPLDDIAVLGGLAIHEPDVVRQVLIWISVGIDAAWEIHRIQVAGEGALARHLAANQVVMLAHFSGEQAADIGHPDLRARKRAFRDDVETFSFNGQREVFLWKRDTPPPSKLLMSRTKNSMIAVGDRD